MEKQGQALHLGWSRHACFALVALLWEKVGEYEPPHTHRCRQALVNAMYHRGYDQLEPVEVRINPDGIDIVSYPGPDPSIRIESLSSGKIMARRYRNRRIGEFLKELELTEGRCTGIPKMRAAMARNGSPEPRFSTDEMRTHFVVELPVHTELVGLALRDGGHEGDHDGGHDGGYQGVPPQELQLLEFVRTGPKSRKEIADFLGISPRGRAVNRILEDLLAKFALEMTVPDRPNSRNQKYRITEFGRTSLENS